MKKNYIVCSYKYQCLVKFSKQGTSQINEINLPAAVGVQSLYVHVNAGRSRVKTPVIDISHGNFQFSFVLLFIGFRICRMIMVCVICISFTINFRILRL